MEENRVLHPEQAWNAMYIFLRDLWFQIEKELSFDRATVEKFLSFCDRLFEEDYDWRRVFIQERKKGLYSGCELNSQQIFALMRAVVLRYKDKYTLDLADLLGLFQAMETDPKEHSFEWALWNDAITKAVANKRWDFPDYLYPQETRKNI